MSYYESASDTWEFLIPRGKIDELARTRCGHHQGRLAHWQDERNRIERQMREGGVTFVAYDHSGGRGMQASLDQQMSVDLSQAMRRIAHHEKEIEFFESVIAGLDASFEDGELPMRLADIRRFGLVASVQDEEPE